MQIAQNALIRITCVRKPQVQRVNNVGGGNLNFQLGLWFAAARIFHAFHERGAAAAASVGGQVMNVVRPPIPHMMMASDSA